jgi:hypothetical protein
MNSFFESFLKTASFRKALISRLMKGDNLGPSALHKLMQGLPVRFKGISTKSLRRTSVGKKL